MGAIFCLVCDVKCKQLALPLFKAFVLPIAEYGSVVWNQNFTTYNELIEKCLRNASRITLDLPISPLHPRYLNYKPRLRQIDFPSLSQRRASAAIIITLKIYRGELHCPSLLYIIQHTINMNFRTRRPNLIHCLNTYCPPKSAAHLISTALTLILSSYSQILNMNYYSVKHLTTAFDPNSSML